jgi:hypothetical protein
VKQRLKYRRLFLPWGRYIYLPCYIEVPRHIQKQGNRDAVSILYDEYGKPLWQFRVVMLYGKNKLPLGRYNVVLKRNEKPLKPRARV